MSPEERARAVAYKHCGDLIPLADAIAAAIRAAVAEERERCAKVADGWRPIAEAPRDGTHVLVADSGVVGEAFFERHDGLWYWSGNHWTDAHDGSIDPPGPTHWQPLPAPPEDR